MRDNLKEVNSSEVYSIENGNIETAILFIVRLKEMGMPREPIYHALERNVDEYFVLHASDCVGGITFPEHFKLWAIVEDKARREALT